MANGSLLNYESATSHTVSVRVTDRGGLTYTEAFQINLSNVNEAPTGANATLTINEDTPRTLTAANFGFSDVDAGDTLSAVRIDTVPSAGSLTLSGVAVTAGQVVSAADITAGRLVFTPAADANGTGYARVTFSVRDSSNAYDTAPNTMTFNVTAVNDAPTDLALSANTVAENAATGTVVGTVSGTDPDSGDTKTYSLTDTAGGRFAINSSTGVITVANGSLLNYESATSHTVTVQVTDSAGQHYTETFTIVLTNVNEGPITVQEGNGEEGSLVASLQSNDSVMFGDHNIAASPSTIVDANQQGELHVPENLRKPVEWNSQPIAPVDMLDSGRNVSKIAPDGDENQAVGSGRNETLSSKQSGITEDPDTAKATRPESGQVPWSPMEEAEQVSDGTSVLSVPMVAGLVGTALQGSLGTKEKMTAMRTRIRRMYQKPEDEKTSQPQGADDKEPPPSAA